MYEKNYKKKIKGSILGSFIGDSIGFLFEGHSQEFIKLYLEKISSGDIINYMRGYSKKLNINGPIHKENEKICDWNFNFGQYTDDSQLSLLVVDNILKNNGIFNIEYYSKQITKIFNEKKIVGYGSTTKNFVKNINNKISLEFSGIYSTSNGALMRSDIFGLLYFNLDDNILFNCVKKQSFMTHMSNVSIACSLCSAFTIKYIMKNKKIENDMLLYELYTKIKNINIDVSNAILNLKSILLLNFNDAYKEIKKYETIKWGDNCLSSCCITTTMWALYSFLKNKNSFKKCLETSIKVGGDVDTISKISCSFSGCYLGIDKLPKNYINKLHDRKKNVYDINLKLNKLTELIRLKKISYQ